MRYVVTVTKDDGQRLKTLECADAPQTVRQMTVQLHMMRKLAKLDFELIAQSALDDTGARLTVGKEVEWFTPGAVIRARALTAEEMELINRKQSVTILRPGERQVKARIN